MRLFLGGQLALAIALHMQKNRFELGWLGILDAAYPGVLNRLQEPAIAPMLLNELYTQIFVFIAQRDTFKIHLKPKLEMAISLTDNPAKKLSDMYIWMSEQFKEQEVIAKASVEQIRQCQQLFMGIYWNILAALEYQPEGQVQNSNNVTLFHTQHDNDKTCMSAFVPEWGRHFVSALRLEYIDGVKHIDLLENPEFSDKLSTAVLYCQPIYREHYQRTTLVSLAKLQALQWNLPEVNPRYVLRAELDTALNTALPSQGFHPAKTVFLDGFGGLGKSQSLSYFLNVTCARRQIPFGVVICFNESEGSDFLTKLRELLKERLPNANPDNLTLNSALQLFYRDYLKTIPGRSLVVFDNVILNANIIKNLGGDFRRDIFVDVFVVTRDADIPRDAQAIHMTAFPFTPSQAVELLSTKSWVDTWSPPDKERLCLRFENYPLALDMAAAFCEKQKLTAEEYLAKLDVLFEQVLGNAVKPMLGINSKYHQTLIPVVLSSIERIKKDENQALFPLMLIISSLDCNAIGYFSLELFISAYFRPDNFHPELLKFLLDSALEILCHLNIIRDTKAGSEGKFWKRISLHGLVAESITRLYSNDTKAVLAKINESFPVYPFNPQNLDEVRCYTLEGHVAMSHYLAQCIKLHVEINQSALQAIADLYLFLNMTGTRVLLEGQPTLQLATLLLDKYERTPKTESDALVFFKALSNLVKYIYNEPRISLELNAIYKTLMAMPLPKQELETIKADYKARHFNSPDVIRFMRSREPRGKSTRPDMADRVIKIATRDQYLDKGNYRDAFPLCLEIVNEMSRDQSVDIKTLADENEKYARCALMLGRFDLALSTMVRVLNDKVKFFSGIPNRDYTASIVRYIETLISCQQVFFMQKFISTRRGVERYLNYQSVFLFRLYRGDYQKGVESIFSMVPKLERGLCVEEQFPTVGVLICDPQEYIVRLLLSKFYFALGDYARVFTCLKPIADSEYGCGIIDYAEALTLMICAELAKGQEPSENSLHKLSETLAKAYPDEINICNAMLLYNQSLSILAREQVDLDKALTLLERAIMIYTTLASGIPYPPLGMCLVLRARIKLLECKQGGKIPEEEINEDLAKALSLYDAAHGFDHPNVIDVEIVQADLSILKGQTLTAYDRLQKIRTLYQQESLLLARQAREIDSKLKSIRDSLRTCPLKHEEITSLLDLSDGQYDLRPREHNQMNQAWRYSRSFYISSVGLLFSPQIHTREKVITAEHSSGLVMQTSKGKNTLL